jgi:DNA-binding MarR family transcriptional regulator
MIAPLKRSLGYLLQVSRDVPVKALREASVGSVVPDMLVGIIRKRPSLLARQRFSTVESAVLALLENTGPLLQSDIEASLYLPSETCERTLRRLSSVGAVRDAPSTGWRISSQVSTTGMEIIAIEAKLRLWKQALAQACSYLSFADRAYVVLDGNQVARTHEMAPAFRQAGVGLWFQNRMRVSSVVEASSRPSPHSGDRFRAATKLLRCRSSIKRGL